MDGIIDVNDLLRHKYASGQDEDDLPDVSDDEAPLPLPDLEVGVTYSSLTAIKEAVKKHAAAENRTMRVKTSD